MIERPLAALAATLVVVASACAPPPAEPAAEAMNSAIALHLQDPELPDEVRLILEQAARDGEVTFEAYRAAGDLYIACLEGEGMSGDLYPAVSQGVTWLVGTVTYPSSVEAGSAEDYRLSDAMDACYATWLNPVEGAHGLQPSSLEGRDLFLDTFRAGFRACLIAEGGEVPEDGGFYEYVDEAREVYFRTGRDCLTETAPSAS